MSAVGTSLLIILIFGTTRTTASFHVDETFTALLESSLRARHAHSVCLMTEFVRFRTLPAYVFGLDDVRTHGLRGERSRDVEYDLLS
jgi:hypothetical protein